MKENDVQYKEENQSKPYLLIMHDVNHQISTTTCSTTCRLSAAQDGKQCKLGLEGEIWMFPKKIDAGKIHPETVFRINICSSVVFKNYDAMAYFKLGLQLSYITSKCYLMSVSLGPKKERCSIFLMFSPIFMLIQPSMPSAALTRHVSGVNRCNWVIFLLWCILGAFSATSPLLLRWNSY